MTLDASIRFLEPATSTGKLDNALVTTDEGPVYRQRVEAHSGGFFPVRAWSQFYNIRGQRHIATTGYVQQSLSAAGELVAMLRNPSNSGRYVVLDKVEFGCTNDTRFSRYGGGTVSIQGGATAAPIGKTNGATSDSTVEIYTAGNGTPEFTVTAQGTLRKVAVMGAYRAYQLNDIEGTVILPPGGISYWRVDEARGGGNGNFFTYIDFEWVEFTTAAYQALEAAVLAKNDF